MKKYNVCVVGATGLVGRKFIEVLAEYDFPIENLYLVASYRSKGKQIAYKGIDYTVIDVEEFDFHLADICLFSAGSDASLKYAPIAESCGCYVIDNSKAWRMDDNCSLIVPEINFEDYKNKSRIIANPNCSTIQCMPPLNSLKKFGIKRINYTTYQAVSGSGKKGVDDYNRTISGQKEQFYPYNISKTCIPQIDEFLDNGYTKEEMKMVNETRKILHLDNLPISATCIRVPVLNSHGVMVQVELEKSFTLDEIYDAFNNAEGVKVLDDPKNKIYPVSTVSNGNDLCYVGRVRYDLSRENSLLFWCVADNIRKGAASNAVQIALKLAKDLDA